MHRQHGQDTTLDNMLKQPSTAFLHNASEDDDDATAILSAESPPPSPPFGTDEEEKFEEYKRLCLTNPHPGVVDLDVTP